MERKFQTTFIPKKPISGSFEVKRREHVSAFLGASVILALITLGLAAGFYFWGKTIGDSIISLDGKINDARKLLDENSFIAFQKLNDRVKSAKSILAGRYSYFDFLSYLERAMLKNISVISLTVKKASGEYTAELDGEALSFQAVALQSDEFAKHPAVKKAIFSDLGMDKTRRVVFQVALAIDPPLINKDLTQPDVPAEDDTTTPAGGDAVAPPADNIPETNASDIDNFRF